MHQQLTEATSIDDNFFTTSPTIPEELINSKAKVNQQSGTKSLNPLTMSFCSQFLSFPSKETPCYYPNGLLQLDYIYCFIGPQIPEKLWYPIRTYLNRNRVFSNDSMAYSRSILISFQSN